MGHIPIARPSPRRRFKVPRAGVALALLVVVFGAVLALVLIFAWPDGGGAPEVPVLIAAGRVEEFQVGEPAHFKDKGFFLIKLESGELLALSDLDTHVAFREQGCRIRWREDLEFNGRPFMGRAEWFRGDCSGSTFDTDGRLVSGPGPRGMDGYRVVIEDDGVFVDTSRLLCGYSSIEQYEYPEYCIPPGAGSGGRG